MKRTVTLEIAGAKYRIVSDADEGHLTHLSSMIDDRIAALGSKAARAVAPAQLLAVVALGLADELCAERQRREAVDELTRRTVGKVIERIERRLEADAALGSGTNAV